MVINRLENWLLICSLVTNSGRQRAITRLNYSFKINKTPQRPTRCKETSQNIVTYQESLGPKGHAVWQTHIGFYVFDLSTAIRKCCSSANDAWIHAAPAPAVAAAAPDESDESDDTDEMAETDETVAAISVHCTRVIIRRPSASPGRYSIMA